MASAAPVAASASAPAAKPSWTATVSSGRSSRVVLPLRGEERRDGGGAEPRGQREQDARGDDRELPPAAGGILRGRRRHSGRIV